VKGVNAPLTAPPTIIGAVFSFASKSRFVLMLSMGVFVLQAIAPLLLMALDMTDSPPFQIHVAFGNCGARF
jgi:hypothetical protein